MLLFAGRQLPTTVRGAQYVKGIAYHDVDGLEKSALILTEHVFDKTLDKVGLPLRVIG